MLLCIKSYNNGHNSIPRFSLGMNTHPEQKPPVLTWTRLSVVADTVDYVMRDFGILWNGKHVVAGARDGVPDQKHPVSLPLQ